MLHPLLQPIERAHDTLQDPRLLCALGARELDFIAQVIYRLLQLPEKPSAGPGNPEYGKCVDNEPQTRRGQDH